MAAIFSVFRCC